MAFCRERLANYKVPRQVEFRAELPRNPSGKVLKRLLRSERPVRMSPTRPGIPAPCQPEPAVRAYEPRGAVALITLNRPRYRNAQNSAMTYALDAAFAARRERRRGAR